MTNGLMKCIYIINKIHSLFYLDIFRYHSQKFGIDGLCGWRSQIHIMQHAMYNTEYRQCYAAWTFFKDFHKKRKHVETEVSVRIIKVFHYTFGPLETFLTESAPAV